MKCYCFTLSGMSQLMPQIILEFEGDWYLIVQLKPDNQTHWIRNPLYGEHTSSITNCVLLNAVLEVPADV